MYLTSQRWATRLLLAQLVIGTLLVNVLTAQRKSPVEQAVHDQEQADRVTALEVRTTTLEQLHIAERLAVVDEEQARGRRMELLMYGVLFTLGGNLLLGLFNKVKSL